MRQVRIVAVLLLAACGGAPAPVAAPATPAVATAPSCADTASHMIELMAGALEPRPPEDLIQGYVTTLRERCEQDGWSAEARTCLGAMQRTEDAEPCSELLTEAQQRALAIGDRTKHYESSPESAPAAEPVVAPQAPAAEPVPAAAPAPPTAPTPRKASKSKAKTLSADPCDGGE